MYRVGGGFTSAIASTEPVFSFKFFLQKEETQMGKPCTQMQMKQLSTGPDDVAGELPEDIRLMRGLCRSERQSRSLTCFEMVYSRVIIDTFI